MKRVVLIHLMLVCAPAFAGLTYKAQSETTGLRNATINGTVSVDGTHMRMDVTQGDNMIFKDNSIVLSNDGGKTMSVLDPSTKTYYDLQLQELLGSATSMLSRLGDVVDKLIEAQSTTMKGFPLKQISTIKVSQGGGSDMTMTTTASVSDIARKNIDASIFAMPGGYTKTDDPVTKMMKQIKMP